MNEQQFRDLLTQLPDESWQALDEGQGLLLVEDQRLEPGPLEAPERIIPPSDTVVSKADCLADAAQLLADYYRNRPLTLAGFNRQARALVDEHGAAAFAAPYGQLPQRSLFVDVGELVAEGPDSPRHRYGAFCELDSPVSGQALEDQVRRWLDNGQAYERYLSMNVCRYNC